MQMSRDSLRNLLMRRFSHGIVKQPRDWWTLVLTRCDNEIDCNPSMVREGVMLPLLQQRHKRAKHGINLLSNSHTSLRREANLFVASVDENMAIIHCDFNDSEETLCLSKGFYYVCRKEV